MKYDINKIRALCERYFDAETSAEEEMILRSYFLKADDIPSDLKAAGTMICGFEAASKMTYVKDAGTRKPARLIWLAASAAAAAAICFGLFRQEIYGYDRDGNIITDPMVALESASCLAYLDNLQTSIDIAQMLTLEMESNN